MNNLPSGCTQDMVDAQCSPVARGMAECDNCAEDFPRTELYPWVRYNHIQRGWGDVLLCEHCVPRCEWRLHHLDLTKCGRIQSPTAQGPWCAEHDKEYEALDNQESEG
jgi:hypothetical protein